MTEILTATTCKHPLQAEDIHKLEFMHVTLYINYTLHQMHMCANHKNHFQSIKTVIR
jgi:hypothetical protein